ncbi:MAG TPA: PKD domain-containing protein [Candidatus Saccharimonadales bacterium]
MTRKISRWLVAFSLLISTMTFGFSQTAFAANFPPESSNGSVGLQGTISTAAPTHGATITTPVNGASFSSLPVTVNGLCPNGLLVKLFANNVFIGSVNCSNSSYSLQVDLFAGQNDLVARVYDALDQAGPDSNTVIVTFNDAQSLQYGSRVALTSPFAKEGANPGSTLTWPIIISGGSGPYAISVDWGDGSPTSLISQPFTGTLNITHVYKTAGVYTIIVKATDINKTEAFLQLVGVANGAAQSNTNGNAKNNTTLKVEVLWWPAVAMLPLIFAAFWIGQRHELFSLRKQIEKTRRDA